MMLEVYIGAGKSALEPWIAFYLSMQYDSFRTYYEETLNRVF